MRVKLVRYYVLLGVLALVLCSSGWALTNTGEKLDLLPGEELTLSGEHNYSKEIRVCDGAVLKLSGSLTLSAPVVRLMPGCRVNGTGQGYSGGKNSNTYGTPAESGQGPGGGSAGRWWHAVVPDDFPVDTRNGESGAGGMYGGSNGTNTGFDIVAGSGGGGSTGRNRAAMVGGQTGFMRGGNGGSGGGLLIIDCQVLYIGGQILMNGRSGGAGATEEYYGETYYGYEGGPGSGGGIMFTASYIGFDAAVLQVKEGVATANYYRGGNPSTATGGRIKAFSYYLDDSVEYDLGQGGSVHFEGNQADFDGDGISDVLEYLRGAEIPEIFFDSDGWGTSDALEDNDGNGLPDAFEDRDRNGQRDGFENFAYVEPPHPNDGDSGGMGCNASGSTKDATGDILVLASMVGIVFIGKKKRY